MNNIMTQYFFISIKIHDQPNKAWGKTPPFYVFFLPATSPFAGCRLFWISLFAYAPAVLFPFVAAGSAFVELLWDSFWVVAAFFAAGPAFSFFHHPFF